jgi:hypothetical protein
MRLGELIPIRMLCMKECSPILLLSVPEEDALSIIGAMSERYGSIYSPVIDEFYGMGTCRYALPRLPHDTVSQ